MDRLLLILLGVFLLLFGIFAVTNLKVEWGPAIMGFSALAAGVVCLVRASRGRQQAARVTRPLTRAVGRRGSGRRPSGSEP